MLDSFLEKALTLNRSGEPYATATIVRRQIPSSGKPGDRAIITPDGKIHGWIGGGCTYGIVLKEALESLRDHKPRIVHISPDALESASGQTKRYTMTCQSGGEVEVYIEPVIPKPQVLIFGKSHIAMALARIARTMDYRVVAVVPELETGVFPTADQVFSNNDFPGGEAFKNSYVVVCTQGKGDTEGLFQALSLNAGYTAFVASRKKANGIFQELRLKGVSFDQLKGIHTPAGLDIGAKLPEEVAISILAQIIMVFRAKQAELEHQQPENPLEVLPNEDYYLNPVCKIPIQKSTARHVLMYNNENVYFCCDGCKVSFEKDPQKYITATGR
jgi:xanthine dehydrogenase accessory factor